MPRQPRIEFEGAHYHVMARGNRLGKIFVDNHDRETWIRTLAEMCEKCDFEVFAWVLMGNHYHIALRTPKGNLVDGMKWFQNTYTRRFNTRHSNWGRVFGDRYKSVLVDPEGGSYLSTLIDYIHLNPVRAKIIKASKGQSLLDFPWSSLSHGYVKPPSKRAAYLVGTEGLSVMGHPDTAKGRRALVARLDRRMAEEGGAKCGLSEIGGQGLQSTLRRGWYWGSEEFKEKMQATFEKKGRAASSGLGRDYAASGVVKQCDDKRAEAILKMAASHFGIGTPSGFLELPRGDPYRVATAWALWKRTSKPHRWIAEHLGYTTAANVSQQARRYERLSEKELPQIERAFRRELINVA